MSISQSRTNSRGQLVAVIKIQIDQGQIDRIFLHQNDDDYKLAQDFQQRHHLNPIFVEHIYQKIKASRETLQKQQQLGIKSPFVNNTQRSNGTFNQSGYLATPGQFQRELENEIYREKEKEQENTYRNYNEGYPTPYNRIDSVAKFTPIPQQTHQSHHIPVNIPKQSKFMSNRQHNLYPQPQQQSTINENSYKNKETIDHSTFETFMQTGKVNSNQNLFQKYLKERKIESSGGIAGIKRLIQKAPPQPQIYYQSQTTSEGMRENKPHPNEIIPINSTDQKKRRTESHYTFNQDKPSHVKILKKDQIQSLNSSMSRQKSLSRLDREKIAKQVTTRLYNESDIKKNYLNKIKERAKQQKQIQQDKQLTYRPHINKVSQLIAADRYKNGQVQDYLIDQAKKAQIKRQAERALKAQKQLQNCSFKPEVNVISQKLVKDASRSLLKQSHSRNNDCSRKHSQSHAAFRPSLNKMSEEIVKNKYEGKFQQRLKGYLEQKNNKLNELTKDKLQRQKVDQKGQQLFRPRIYSKPVNRSPKGAQIHDYLYQMSKINKTLPIQDQKPTINQNSQQIIQQMYMKRVAWLFSQLDSDQDGFISPKRTCIDTISSQLLQIIAPILFQMQQLNVQLNLIQFRNAIKNLHPSLNAHQKSILYSYSHKTQENQNKGVR